MKLLQWLGLAKRRAWQELVGLRPHLIDPSSAEAGYGKRKSYKVQDRIALINVRGLLINDEDWWDGWGCSTYDRIVEEVRGAVADPAVDGILLQVNSPGGECDNGFETAAEIVAAGKVKPVWAVAETVAYSGGYLLAASASRIYVPQYTGGVGSIGVYGVHLDYSGYLDQWGIKPTFIEAGKGKTEGHPYKPLNAAAKQRLQAEIDRLYGLFVDHVAAQRSLPAGTIREFGARLWHGAEAIAAGMADKVGNTVTVLAEFRAYLDERAAMALVGGAAAAAQPGPVAEATGPDAAAQEAASAAAAPETTVVAEGAVAHAEPTPALVVEDPLVAARRAAATSDRIRALCAVARLSANATEELLASGKTPEEVESELCAARAAESEANEIVSQVQPATSATSASDALVKAAERIAAEHTQTLHSQPRAAAAAEAANPSNQSAIVKAAEKLAQAGKEK